MRYSIKHPDSSIQIIECEYFAIKEETGQAFAHSKEEIVAIVPKECLVVKTEDYTELQKTIENLIIDISEQNHFNDLERAIPEYNTLEYWKENHCQGIVNILKEALEKIQ